MNSEISKDSLILGLIQNNGIPLSVIVKIIRANDKKEITKILKNGRKVYRRICNENI